MKAEESMSRVSVLEHMFDRGEMTPSVARYFLTFDFPPSQHRRYKTLSEKSQRGKLTAKEQSELGWLLLLNDFIGIAQSRARMTLKQRRPSAA
jgi:hypothetical protein